MIRDAQIHPLASRELEEAALFYDQRQLGLGQRFMDAVERAIEHVLLFPEAAPIIGKTVRRKKLDRFPYSLVYSLEEGRIYFLAIAHHRRAPTYWAHRLSGHI